MRTMVTLEDLIDDKMGIYTYIPATMDVKDIIQDKVCFQLSNTAAIVIPWVIDNKIGNSHEKIKNK